MRALMIALVVTLSSLGSAGAATRADVQTLYDALLMPDVIEIMQAEGLDYGEDLRGELFPGRGGGAWSALVGQLYDGAAMNEVVLDRFAELLADTDIAPLLAFFQSERGARIVRLELEARRAMMDEDVEEAAKDSLRDMRQDGAPRLAALDEFVAANELVESNVVGAMNANYAFYVGLMEGGAFAGEMTEDQVLSDVWSQEPEIRADTIEWVYSYLALAYQPLTDDDLAAYTDLSHEAAGRALNQAVFGAFDTMYVTISRALGRGAAQFILGEDL